MQKTYDLLVAEVVAAHADARVFLDGYWNFEGNDALRTLHFAHAEQFFVAGRG